MNRNSRSVLKPRVSNIPISNSSKNAEVRKSTSTLVNKCKRSSADRLSRISLASGKGIIPNQYMTPVRSNHLTVGSSSSVNRQSISTIRSSYGPSSKKDVWPLADQKSKIKAIDGILKFLMMRRYTGPCMTKDKLSFCPKTDDLRNLFMFIFRHIDPNYNPSNKWKEEIPEILKLLSCKIVIPKSCLKYAIIPPLNWPSILSMFCWMTNVIELMEDFNDDEGAYSMDFSDPSSAIIKRRFEDLVKIYHDDSIEPQVLQDFANIVDENNHDPDPFLREERELDIQIEKLPCVKVQLDSLRAKQDQLKMDERMLTEYNEKLMDYMDQKMQEKNVLEVQLNNKKKLNDEILKEIEQIKAIKSTQDPFEVKKLKNRISEISIEMEHEHEEEKKLRKELCSAEMEMSKAQKLKVSVICDFKTLCRNLNYKNIDSAHLMSLKAEELIQLWDEDFVPFIKVEKKKRRDLLSEEKDYHSIAIRNNKKCLEYINDLENDKKSLECKKKRFEEEVNCSKKEADSEIFELQKQIDIVIERLHQAKIQPKSCIYTKQKELDEAKSELQMWIAKNKEIRKQGIQLLKEDENMFEEYFEFRKQATAEYDLFEQKLAVEQTKRLEEQSEILACLEERFHSTN